MGLVARKYDMNKFVDIMHNMYVIGSTLMGIRDDHGIMVIVTDQSV